MAEYIEFEELKTWTLEQAKHHVNRAIYDAALIFERLENARLVHGNGHHMAQKMAADAEKLLVERWTGPKT